MAERAIDTATDVSRTLTEVSDALQSAAGAKWECTWKDARWNVPIVSLYADGRRVLGVAADGGMVEGLSGG